MYALKARDKLHKKEKVDRRKSGDGQRSSSSALLPPTQAYTAIREAKYIGTFSIDMIPAWKNDTGKAVKHHLSKLKTKDSSSCQLPVAIHINMEGVKVISVGGSELIMAHALRKILYSASDGKKHLFAMVTSNPDTGPEGIYSHVFGTGKKDQANELNVLVGKAFKASFTKKSLKRHKQRIKDIRPTSFIQEPPQPIPSQQPTPSAPPPTAPPPTFSPPLSPIDHTEVAQLEIEVTRLRARITEIEHQIPAVATIEDAVVELTVQLSSLQQQLDDKQRRLATIEQTPPPSYNGLYPALPSTFDFASISLDDADWFQEGLPREVAMEILSFQPEGGFIVRRSNSNPGCYALSLKGPLNKIFHYLIESLPGSGFRVQGGATVFISLVDLIQHHTVHIENLPCTLNMDTSNPAFLGGAPPDSDSDPDDVDFAAQTQYHMLS